MKRLFLYLLTLVIALSSIGQFTSTYLLGQLRSAIAPNLSSYVITHRSDDVTGANHDGTEIIQIGNYMYSFGGWQPGVSNNEIFRSVYPFTTWESRGNAPWTGRHTFGCGKIGSTIYVWGGDHINPAADCWSTTDGENWTQLATDAWPIRTIYGACVFNNKLWIMGGQDTSLTHTSPSFYDVYSSPDGITWTQVSNNSANDFLWKNLSGTVTSFNGAIHLISGGIYGTDYGDQEHRVTTDGITFTQLENVPFVGKQYINSIEWDGKLWVICGFRFVNTKSIWYLNTDNTWHRFIPPTDFEARHATGVGVFDDGVHSCLVLTNGNFHDDCWTIEKE